MSALDEATFGTAKLLFDDTDQGWRSTTRHRCHLLLRGAALPGARGPAPDRGERGRCRPSKERHGVPIDPHEPLSVDPQAAYGYDYDDPANLPFWWSQGALTSWQLVPSTILCGEPVPALGHRSLRRVRRHLRQLVDVGPAAGAGGRPGAGPDGGVRGAQRGAHLHLAQPRGDAELGRRPPRRRRPRPGARLAGHDRPRRAGVHHAPVQADAAVARLGGGLGLLDRRRRRCRAPRSTTTSRSTSTRPAYKSPTDPLLGPIFGYLNETHAYFPQDHFDEVVQTGGWTIGRKGDGYVALWSHRPTVWRIYDPAVVATRGWSSPSTWSPRAARRTSGSSRWAVAPTRATSSTFVDRDRRGRGRGDPPGGRPATVSEPGSCRPPRASWCSRAARGCSVGGAAVPVADHPRLESPWGEVCHLGRFLALTEGGSLARDRLRQGRPRGQLNRDVTRRCRRAPRCARRCAVRHGRRAPRPPRPSTPPARRGGGCCPPRPCRRARRAPARRPLG